MRSCQLELASKRAYAMAGITSPSKEIDFVELSESGFAPELTSRRPGGCREAIQA